MQLSPDITVSPNWNLGYMDGMRFTTHDRDQDAWSRGNCANLHHGAWWYRQCYVANPNGIYLTPGTDDDTSMNYYTYKANYESLRAIKLMFR